VLRKRVNFALTTGVSSGGGSSNNINININNNNNTSSSNNIKSINKKENQNQNKNNKEKKKTNMNNKFILIHIGPSKTGTTSIVSTVYCNTIIALHCIALHSGR